MAYLTNRRAHLVVALTVLVASLAVVVARSVEVEALAPTALRACALSSLVLGSLVLLSVSKRDRGVASASIALSAIAGGVVGVVTQQCVFVDRPEAALSFGGVEAGPVEAFLLASAIGGAVGGVVAVFARASRRIARSEPELACVLGWVLAAAALVLARHPLATLLPALGIGVQLASRQRARGVAPARLGPYR